MPGNHWLFVTGKLAEPSLRRLLAELAPRVGFEHTVAVLPITVAALATSDWIARHLSVPPGIDRILLPGLVQGDIAVVENKLGVPATLGPPDLRDLPEYFGSKLAARQTYGAYDISIIAEINHAPRLALADTLAQAQALVCDGADIIDLGCDPGATWSGLSEAVRALRDQGLRVSVDTFNPEEAAAGAAAGAELILSVNSTNVAQARSWGCEVVAVPDMLATLGGLDSTVEHLDKAGVPFQIDPVIEPIGFGFAASLGRYLEARRRFPKAEMLMGVGNLTELTDVDSAGVNVLLAGFCQELGIRSVLTTQVINWCRSSVRELNLARRLVHCACREHVLPKHVAPDLVLLRDPKLREHGPATLSELAGRLTDPNFRLFAEAGEIHAMNGKMHLRGPDPFALFAEMHRRDPLDPSHAFYLGYEMAKAVTALTLGKNYAQDQALRWGFLSVPEPCHRGKMQFESPPNSTQE